MDELVALAGGQEIGRITQGPNARLSLVYDDAWRQTADAYPISLSLPLVQHQHGHDPLSAFLMGLLPDNDRILESWGRRFGVSARNPFGLLTHVGEECAGAIQFVRPERVQDLRDDQPEDIRWLTDADIAERLRTLRVDHAAWRTAGDEGQFSLAGAQPKTAFIRRNDRWGIPAGRTPTTHILKVPNPSWDGYLENEQLCLGIARALDLPTAASSIIRFEDQVAIVVERYDRVAGDGRMVRVHQEDLCQALGVPPTRKYENEGGPGVAPIVGVLRDHSRQAAEDVAVFLDALALNWIIGGTDGHAKNFSILLGAGGRVRLAPLYDIASALPYPSLSIHKVKLAMTIGGEYLVQRIGRRQWEKLAKAIRTTPDALIQRVLGLTERVPDIAAGVRQTMEGSGIRHAILRQLQEAIAERASQCRNALLGAE